MKIALMEGQKNIVIVASKSMPNPKSCADQQFIGNIFLRLSDFGTVVVRF